MYIKFYKIIFLTFLFFSFSVCGVNDLIGKKYLCANFLWGFEFFSSDKVNVIRTDINNKSIIQQYKFHIIGVLGFSGYHIQSFHNWSI